MYLLYSEFTSAVCSSAASFGRLARRGFVAGALTIAVLALAAGASAQNNPTPQVTQPLSPSSAVPGAAAFTLTVRGAGFLSSSTVNWNGSPRTTTFVSSDALTAAITAADIAAAGTSAITVVSPPTAGISNISNTVFFPVNTKLKNNVGFTKTDFTVGNGPVAVAVGDFRGIGRRDLAVANSLNNTLSILLSNGDGTFQPQAVVPIVGFPVDIVARDFNNDGKVDIATMGQNNSSVSVLLGNGDGTFQMHKEFAVGAKPQAFTIGDFNADGKLDIATANFNSNNVSVLIGNGDGTFQPHIDYATGGNPLAITNADFNGDGKLDLAVVNNNDNTVSILLGNGDGSFQGQSVAPTAISPNAIVAADFNGDGIVDLATSNGSQTISVLLGTGTGSFPTHTELASGSFPFAISVGDFNNDGKLDIIVPNFNDGNVSVYLGLGNGGFQARQNFITGVNPVALAVADFQNDGRLDIAVADEGSNAVSLLTQIVVTPPVITPTSLSFGSQQAGVMSAAQNVTVTNPGTAALAISGISVTGRNNVDFTQTNTCGSSIAPGASCTISVVFFPQTVGNNKQAFVTITDTAGSQLVTLGGTAKQSIGINPIKIAFGLQLVGTPGPVHPITITNDSGIFLSITSISTTGANAADFVQTNNCGTGLPGFGSCVVNVSFTPTDINGRTSVLIVLSSANTPKRGSSFTGIGTEVSISSNSLTFPPQTVGTTSNPMTFTFQNTGPSALPISSVNIFGPGAADFAQTNTCGSSVGPGVTCTFSVTFTPKKVGTRTATITIGDPDPTGPQRVTLSGTGQ